MAGLAESLKQTHLKLSKIWSSPGTHSRLFVDQAPTWDDWRLHRSSAWRHRIEPIVFFRVAVGFTWQLIHVVVVSVLIGLYSEFLVPKGAPEISDKLAGPFSLMTFVVSLLLVFKTNSSYARWWEARVIWGQVVNYARNLPRTLLAFCPPDLATPLQLDMLKAVMRWTAASSHVLRGHVRERTFPKCEEEAAHLLSPAEREYLRTYWANKPQGVAYVLSWLCTHRLLNICSMHQVSIEQEITVFVNMAGGCERILKTAIPKAYTRHTSRFLLLYITFSPLLLWSSLGWVTPAAAAFIAFLLLGTENIGIQIEEPFRVLPLETISRGMEQGIREMAAASLGFDLTPPDTPLPSSASANPQKAAASQHAPGTPLGNAAVLVRALGLDHHPEMQQLYGIQPSTATKPRQDTVRHTTVSWSDSGTMAAHKTSTMGTSLLAPSVQAQLHPSSSSAGLLPHVTSSTSLSMQDAARDQHPPAHTVTHVSSCTSLSLSDMPPQHHSSTVVGSYSSDGDGDQRGSVVTRRYSAQQCENPPSHMTVKVCASGAAPCQQQVNVNKAAASSTSMLPGCGASTQQQANTQSLL